MALTSGTCVGVHCVRADVLGPPTKGLEWALVLFTMSGTYDQSANSSLVGVPTLIQNSRRNGKTVNMVGTMIGQAATKASDPSAIFGLKTVAISTNDVTFELTDGDYSTELAAAAIPAQDRPFGILVSFYES